MVLARSYYGIPAPLSPAARLLHGGAAAIPSLTCGKAIIESPPTTDSAVSSGWRHSIWHTTNCLRMATKMPTPAPLSMAFSKSEQHHFRFILQWYALNVPRLLAVRRFIASKGVRR